MNTPTRLYLDPEYQAAQGLPRTALQQAAEGNVQALLYLGYFAMNNENGSIQKLEREDEIESIRTTDDESTQCDAQERRWKRASSRPVSFVDTRRQVG
mmetsp:Transcript_15554/g.42952  ORF Transcript_15554/g.42952 Transcript_15554/m.42952 type:complete len:98 (-) Transcript_15554:79-372(-)